MSALAAGDRVYVIAETAPPCRAGVVQTVHKIPWNGEFLRLRGYTVLHDVPEPDSDGFVERLFEQKEKRDWNWAPHEIVPFADFERAVQACHGDASQALVRLRAGVST